MAEIEDILTELVKDVEKRISLHIYGDNNMECPYNITAITNAAKQIRQQQREFPDEALKKLLIDSASLTPEALFWKIKCLIQGRPDYTCQTCGGSGKNELAGSSFVLDGFSDECSDCTGTGKQPTTTEEATDGHG